MSNNGKRWSQRVLIGGDESAAAFVEPMNTAPAGTEYAVPVRQVGAVTPSTLIGTPVTGSITAQGQSVEVNVEGFGSCGITLSGIWSGTLLSQKSNDGGVTWDQVSVQSGDQTLSGPTSGSGGNFSPVTMQGATDIRMYMNSASTGTVNVTLTPIFAASTFPPGISSPSPGNSFYRVGGANLDGSGPLELPLRSPVAADWLSDFGVVVHHAGGWIDDSNLAGLSRGGGMVDDGSPSTISDTQFGIIRITPKRAQHINLRNQAGTEIGTATDPVRAAQTPVTSGGLSTYHLVSAATTNATVVKASAGQLYGYYIYNSSAAVSKVAFHNTASAPTAGASIFLTIPIPAGGGANVEFTSGIAFSTGIAFTTVTGLADSDNTAVAANDLIINLFYK